MQCPILLSALLRQRMTKYGPVAIGWPQYGQSPQSRAICGLVHPRAAATHRRMPDPIAISRTDTSTSLTGRQIYIVLGLAAAQCLGSAGQILMATFSAIVGATLSPTPQLATLPVTAGILGVALATLPAAASIRRYGRGPVFVGASFIGAAGAASAATAIHFGSFSGFCISCFVMGANVAVIAQYRFAVTEIVPTAMIGRAISALMLGTLLAAIAAPSIAMQTRSLLTVDFSGSYAALPLLYLAAAAILVVIPLGRPQKNVDRPIETPPVGQILARRPVQLAIVSAAVSYGAMSLIMTATPISMHVIDLHSISATANTIRGHLLAMFVPSLFSGWLISRLGITRMLWIGIFLIVACIALSVSGQEIWHYRYALIALGIGWNFLFISGTTLLATECTDDEVLRVQGINDFVMFATMAIASLSAGALLDSVGWAWTNLAALMLLMLAVVALIRNKK